MYINEIIRITYKCNWKCKFCNVSKTNNFWDKDVTSNEVIAKILALVKKYTIKDRKNLTLSFSWWEPTLDKNLLSYIKLAKEIWLGFVEVQTNWTKLFKDKEFIHDLIDAWLDSIFLAQHSFDKNINNKLGIYYNIDDFIAWWNYILEKKLYKKIDIYLNIVVNKINIFHIYDYLNFLIKSWFINIIKIRDSSKGKLRKISFWLVQPNWYAYINKDEVLLKYDDLEINELDRIINLCRQNKIFTDFHFTAPPVCILNYPEYNLEHEILTNLELDKKSWKVNTSNLESYKFLWKEKQKFKECEKCKYNNYCLWFYNNWINFVWEEYAKEKINKFINSNGK
jgi:MoaA/NifB/PqqE/SkfB family radical SAM enzyme